MTLRLLKGIFITTPDYGLITRCWDYDYYRHDVDDGTMTTGDDYSLHVALRLLAVTIR